MAELQLTHIFKILTSTGSTGSEYNGLFLFFEPDLLSELNKALTQQINSYDVLLDIYNKNKNNTELIQKLQKNSLPRFIIGDFKRENDKLTLTPDKKYSNIELINTIKKYKKVYISIVYAPDPASAPASAPAPDRNYLEYTVINNGNTIELKETGDITEQPIIVTLPIPTLNIYPPTTTTGGSNKSLPRQTRHFTRKIRPSVNSL